MIDCKLINPGSQVLNKIYFLFLLLAGSLAAQAQVEKHRLYQEDQPYYFGLTLGYNNSYLKQTKSPNFLQNDSVLSVEPGSSGGIIMGLMATGRLSNRFQVRFNPQLIIGGAKYLTYQLKNTKPGEAASQRLILPATLVSFPIQLKFNSDRLGNFRTYLMAGVKYDMDLSSNSAIRNADDIIKLSGSDLGIEAGIGFNIYLPFVTVSPEIKISNGLSNIHIKNPGLKYSNVLDKIQSRMIIFSIHLED